MGKHMQPTGFPFDMTVTDMTKIKLRALARKGVELTIVGPAEDEDQWVWAAVGDALSEAWLVFHEQRVAIEFRQRMLESLIAAQLKAQRVNVRLTETRVHFDLTDSMGREVSGSREFEVVEGGVALC